MINNAYAREKWVLLNDCLYARLSFGQSIFDVLLNFRVHLVTLAMDIN